MGEPRPGAPLGVAVTGALKAGDVIRLTRAASPQFVRPLTVRVIRELTDRHTYHGWVWVEGYELGRNGMALARRELFVLREGVRVLPPTPTITAQPATRRLGRTPVRAGA
ncbi:hypothetical protein DKT68_11485 [Micromonospora acroterricola]|uniref:Uncharacterized protein n=1 Tax=Micromonospora acroterricola TaxID=2202421 RepID=A0A317DA44_9ACTN|nr:hypothetical protein [Micromonospora acroterricola]PWR09663.1 hypothetical protein DKT68_11485 [Micromonospora acroterricola]